MDNAALVLPTLPDDLETLSNLYLDWFGTYPPIHRMPDDLAVEVVKGALRSGEPVAPEPFEGSGCNCA